MAKLLYVASPIDRGTYADVNINLKIAMEVVKNPGWVVYDPRTAFTVHNNTEPDNKIAHVNLVVLRKAAALIAHLPKGVVTVGTFMDIAQAVSFGIPVAWFGDDEWARHWSLGLHGIMRTESWEGAVAYCLGKVAENGHLERMQELRVQLLTDDAQMPTQAYQNDAGLDLYVSETTVINPGEWQDVPLGIAIQPPPGIWYRIVGRSSTFRKRRLLVLEGILDNGYRGALYAGVTNLSKKPVTVEVGERIAQMLPSWNIPCDIVKVHEVSGSERNGAGFGSSGV